VDDLWEKFNPDVLAAYERDNGPVVYDEDRLDWMDEEEETDDDDDEKTDKLESDEAKQARYITKLKWEELRDPVLPEPLDFEPVTYTVQHTLRDRFKDSGLQVIVKMASIELTPEKPEFPAGGWHVSNSPPFCS
jgi:hypothetical protein